MVRGILSAAALLITASQAFALENLATGDTAVDADPSHYTSYYVIDEPQAFANVAEATTSSLDPRFAMMNLVDSTVQAAAGLMRWTVDHTNWPDPTEAYNRTRHFGSWLPGDTTPACVNTRGHVLERDSDGPVTMNPSGCTVKTGLWHDPYTGTDITEASKMQIDHVVPLKNAYVSGAWKWDRRTRCAYANFMANGFHLLAVSGHENMSKGDGTPADYMPPNPAFACNYLRDWLEIKLIWGLIMNPDESTAIKTLFAQNHCDPSTFRLDAVTLAKQRAAINDEMAHCPMPKAPTPTASGDEMN